MPPAKKPLPDAVASGVDALATLVAERSKSAESPSGVWFKLPKHPARLAKGELLIAVIEDNAVVVRTVRRPPGLRVGGWSNAVRASYVAQRLGDIETTVGQVLNAALGGASESSVLTEDEERVLASGDLDTSSLPVEDAEPITRAALEYAHLLQSSLSVDEAAKRLDVDPSRIRQRLAGESRTLYGVKEGKSWRLPRFQFAGRKPVPGVDRVIAALPADLHPVAVWRWFTTPHPDLCADAEEEQPISPLDWLRTGRPPEVVAEIARGA
ncbi:MAG: hypothetical protein ACREOC_02495 [Gemmatimonadales bacterium]